jgi:hypothetical protein
VALVASVRAEFVAYLRRTEGRFAAIAAVTAASAVLVGVVGVLAVRDRQALLDDAVERRAQLTAAALDVYRTFADADANALDAVLVEPERASLLRKQHKEDVFDATDALRMAASRDPEGVSVDRVRQLVDLVPEYVRLVEAGWTNSLEKQPVGTSYLAQASFLVRNKILTTAKELYDDQTKALATAQRAAGRPTWPTFLAGALALVILVAAQRFLFHRTRRRFNTGLVAATVLTAIALVWLGTALAIAASNADDSVRGREVLVAPLAKARNLGREADGNEARMLIFPKLGDKDRLGTSLSDIEQLLDDARRNAGAGAERDHLDQASTALRSWREADHQLLEPPNPPPPYPQLAELITGIPKNNPASYASQLDKHLTEAIDGYTKNAAAAAASARRTLANLDVIIIGLTVAAAAGAVAGLWPRIAEYYR